MAIMSIYTSLRTSLESHLSSALSTLERIRHEPTRTIDPITDPIDDQTMGRLVDGVVGRLQGLIAEDEKAQDGERLRRRNEVVRQALERSLEERLHDTAWSSVDSVAGSPALQFDLLDLMQTFSERGEIAADNQMKHEALSVASETPSQTGHTDVVSPLNAISALLDMQTISQCESTWLYIESRSKRLTKDMVPGKGKGLIILRMLNELLRRLPRSKQEHVIFSGRILVFLSSVFPLSEKSGVNLRGNFNTGKKTLYDEDAGRKGEEEGKKEGRENGEETDPEQEEDGKDRQKAADQEKETEPTAEVKEDKVDSFYPIFWSLQRIFTDPVGLVASPPPVRGPDALDELRLQLSKTLDMFAVETKKEKNLTGAATDPTKVVANGKALTLAMVTDGLVDEEALGEYFFPRFLTSRNLLKLELADQTFRRQILVQFLILFQFLISLTPPERIRTLSHGVTNTLVYGPHEVGAKHEKWLRDLRERSVRELDAMQHGRRFRDAIEVMLKREQHWINWKLQSCKPFELSPLPIDQVSKTARSKLVTLSRKPKNYPYKLGNPVLSRLWERNLTTLKDYELDLPRDDFDSLLVEWQRCEKMIKSKKAVMEDESTDKVKKEEVKGEVKQHELRLYSLHWRATRAASLQHLNLFNKIKAGDLDLLLKAIEDTNRAPEEPTSPETTQQVGEKVKEGTAAEGQKEMEGVEVEMEMAPRLGSTREAPPLEGEGWIRKPSRVVLIETDDEKSVHGSPKRSIADAAIEGVDEGSAASEAKRAKTDEEV
ncbi:BZ3500_MvSof-1268-A1-R1_Chr4-1g06819 [Microbotryum saponariae]|uniref:BZ3500_MvSof-1268-A1-R1_Chr4-1g06819 protein n=1 Tax=Microbotryum saponariae TaxID=289078 RepID=A0A2X0NKF0_9BASI|nr:BZ3500_MvSof-1268-A1-R1_Chr4-1g06819 [Microbotryum saponariae]SDA06476.1 BZ3501_MvSof-1269-A2-R1_Chr4-1g06521 [Microbotryum saponariae]